MTVDNWNNLFGESEISYMDGGFMLRNIYNGVGLVQMYAGDRLYLIFSADMTMSFFQ